MKRKLTDPGARVRCYIEPTKDQWQAFCIDLTLAAQADTREQAIEKLDDQIADYIDDAVQAQDQIIRRAPLRYWLKYYYYVALDKIHYYPFGG